MAHFPRLSPDFPLPNSCHYTDSMPRPRKTSSQGHHRQNPSRPAVPRGKIAAPWTLRKSRGLQILQLAPFCKIPWLVHGFSTRTGGVSTLDNEKLLNLSNMEWDRPDNVVENRRKFQSVLGAQNLTLVPLKQIHSALLRPCSAPPAQPCKGDASATITPGLLLAAQTADCVPILLVDPKKRAVAAIHAGWKGTLSRIAEKAVGRMHYEYGSRPSDLLAALGPAIGPCCYEVGAEFVSKFTAQFADAADYFDEPRSGEEPNPLQWLNMMPPGHQPSPKGVHLDLRKANRSQLLAAGVRPKNILVSDLCTACRTDLFFSYRREGALSGRLMSVIGIKRE
jgi:purine-nucleoside/S-methyl-5'-thioadenosine phosphorylase / adenosine deaminase